MKRIRYSSLAFAAVLALGLVASSLAMAQGDGRTCPGFTPSPNSAQVLTRVFNDCPTSVVTVVNTYPALISIEDAVNDCFGFTNLHNWSFSEDGGISKAAFENCSHYVFSATCAISGTGAGEGGLRVSPWWSLDVDGRFMLNVGSGEIACFGGRLPFYSFTVANGLHYTPGTSAWLEISYNPHSLTSVDPATIAYKLFYQGNLYYSPYIPFDQGNAAEDPPHGLWGELVPAAVGGYFQPNCGHGVPNDLTMTWSNIHFSGPEATPTTTTTWGKVKSLYR